MAPTPLPVQPAAAGAAPIIAYGVPALVSSIAFLGMHWSQTAKPLLVETGNSLVIAFNASVDVLVISRNTMGLTATELGYIFRKDTEFDKEPTKEEAERGEAEARPNDATDKANQLTKEHEERKTGGMCTPERLAELEAQKRELCYNWDDGPDILGRKRLGDSMTCKKSLVLSAFQITVRARMNAACARVRDQIRKECFDGGDKDHREESRKSWENAVTCLNRSELK